MEKEFVVFETEINTLLIIEKILEKNGIRETQEETYNKIIEGNESIKISVLKKTEDLFLKKITEKDFIFFLENEIKINENDSNNVLNDIKQELISIARKVNIKNRQDNKEKKILEEKKKESLFSNFLEEYKIEDNYKEKIE